MKDSFASRLKYFRTVKGYSQQELSDKSGVSRKQISDLELGIQKNPRNSTKLKLADALDIDVLNFIPDFKIPDKIDPNTPTTTIELNLNDLPEGTIDNISHRMKISGRSFDEELTFFLMEAINEMFEKEKQDRLNSRGESFASRINELEKQFAALIAEQNKKED